MKTTVKKREYLRNPLKRRIHDEAPHVMHVCDIDAAVFRWKSGILRVIECKYRNEDVRKSQQAVLAKLAVLIEMGIKLGLVSAGSGVFVTRYDNGDPTVLVLRIASDKYYQVESAEEIPLHDFLNNWICCYEE